VIEHAYNKMCLKFSPGEESLCRLKEEVRRFAVDHTFKETAKKFGIHHSTVSGWVKAGEQVLITLYGHSFKNLDLFKREND